MLKVWLSERKKYVLPGMWTVAESLDVYLKDAQ